MLYNKYRPKRFEDVVGQVAAVVLKNAANNKRKFPHSLLFSGTRGTGKTTLARIFAKALNCTAELGKRPCGKCESCKLTNHPDIIEVDTAANGNPSSLAGIVRMMGNIPEYSTKVFIFDEAHAITIKGMDMLLKTVEEPSAHTVCMFLTTNPDKINPALRSRCCWLQLRNLSKKETMKVIAKACLGENISITMRAIARLADYANGSARDSLSLLESVRSMEGLIKASTVDFVVGHRVDVKGLIQAIKARDAAEAMEEVGNLCFYHEAILVAEAAIAECMVEARKALAENRPAGVYADWSSIFAVAKADMKQGSYFPQAYLEVAVAEILIREHAVPPLDAVKLFDWSSFVAFAKTKSELVAKKANKLKYVRFKGENGVICKRLNRDKPFKPEHVTAVRDAIREYLRKPAITLEVV